MRRLLLAVSVCAFAGLLGGLGYAALTAPPYTARAMILLRPALPIVTLPYVPPPATGPGVEVTQLSYNVLEVSAQRDDAAQAEAAAGAAVRRYRAKAEGAKVLDEVAIMPRHQDRRLSALAVAGALVGALAGALGAATRRRTAGP
jgi:hypothetical protein